MAQHHIVFSSPPHDNNLKGMSNIEQEEPQKKS